MPILGRTITLPWNAGLAKPHETGRCCRLERFMTSCPLTKDPAGCCAPQPAARKILARYLCSAAPCWRHFSPLVFSLLGGFKPVSTSVFVTLSRHCLQAHRYELAGTNISYRALAAISRSSDEEPEPFKLTALQDAVENTTDKDRRLHARRFGAVWAPRQA